MLLRPCLLSVIMAAACTTLALADEPKTSPKEVPGWGRVVDPWRDCTFSLDRENDRLRIHVPGTAHVLSAEVAELPMNAPRVLRRVRGDFTATVHVMGRFEPGRYRTTPYDPYHGAGLIIWQDRSNYLRIERAVGYIKGRNQPYINYELREGGRLTVTEGISIAGHPLFLKIQRRGGAFTGGYSQDGRRWTGLDRIDTTFADRVDIGAVAINSSKEPLSAELEMLNIEDPQGSIARDYADSAEDAR
jgi:regulation of enolase protein 1 (concanavalin A-like superfamily)